METLMKIFQICFFVGVGLTLISLVFGNLFDLLHLDATDVDVDVDSSGGLPFSPMVVIVFVTVFGGMGMILTKAGRFSGVVTVAAAIGTGGIVGYFLQHFVFRLLKKAQNTSAPEEEELIGLPAKVNETIFSGGFGEITYLINGNSFVAPAKSVDGSEVKKGYEVSICWIQDHVFYVTPLLSDMEKYDESRKRPENPAQEETSFSEPKKTGEK